MYYFKTEYSTWSNWKNPKSGTSKSYGALLGTFGDKIAEISNLINSPLAAAEGTLLTTPIWTADQGSQTPAIKVKLPLINDISKSILDGWIFRNYRFLQNLMAGTMPVSMQKSIMQPPNLYRVIIPGKLYIHWASVQIDVNALGKQHKIPEFSKVLNSKYEISSIDENTLWPELWQLNITIKNLLPTTFTTYADFLMHDNGATNFINTHPVHTTRVYGKISNFEYYYNKETKDTEACRPYLIL